MINNKKGILLITMLLIVAGLASAIALTIPREVKNFQRSQEKKFKESLMAIETGINNALREKEFFEIVSFSDSSKIKSIPVYNLDTNETDSNLANEWIYSYTNNYYRQTIVDDFANDNYYATDFLKNLALDPSDPLSRSGFISKRSFMINPNNTDGKTGPVFNNKSSHWRIIITESPTPIKYIEYP